MVGRQIMSLVGLLIVTVRLLQSANAATIYTVGDNSGWTVPSNNSAKFYEDWAKNKTFLIGDTLVFNWTGTHTTTEVGNEELYKNCTKTGIVIKTSGVNVRLSTNGTRYFVCSVGRHCEQGMKVAIKVGNGIAPPPFSNAAIRSASIVSFTVFFSSLVILLSSYM